MSSIQLSPSVICRLRVGKVFTDVAFEQKYPTPFHGTDQNAPLISSLEYDESGSTLFALCGASNTLIVMDAINDPSIKSVHKFAHTGIGIFRAGHHPSLVFHSTTRLEGL